MRTRKQGFTLTELVVVIVIIGILASVLIVTLVNYIGSARVSSDTQLIKQLNDALVNDEVTLKEGRIHKNFTEALDAAEDSGFLVDKINAKARNNEILWDSERDVFCYLKGNQIEYIDGKAPLSDRSKYWSIMEITASTNLNTIEFSVYARKSNVTNISTNKGFDAGKTDNITSIIYENNTGRTSVIRTNGGTLTIDAANDSVRHYGEATFLDIKAVKNSSYHEFGYVPYAQIKTGRIVNEVYAEDEKGVQNLFLVAQNETSFAEIVIGSAPGAKLPSLDRTDVNIGDGVKVCEVQTGVTETSTATKDYVWLFGDGTVESQKVVVTSSTTKPSDTGTIDTSTSQGKAANELANISGKAKASAEDIAVGNAQFSGGAGVEANPYFISTVEQFKKIDGATYEGKAFLLTENIVIDVKDFTNKAFIANFNGVFDGGNHRINITNTTNIDDLDTTAKTNVYRIFDKIQGKLSNFVVVNQTGYVCSIVGTGFDSSPYELTFENVDYGYEGINATIEMKAQDCGLFVQTNVGNVSFTKCNNYYNIVSDPVKVGIFVGGRAADKDTSSIEYSFDSCNNYGDIRATVFGILIGNANNNRSITNTTITNCHNYGSLIASSRIGFINDGNRGEIIDEIWSGSLINHSSISIMNDGTELTEDSNNYPNYLITKGAAEVSKYVLVFAENLHFTNDVHYSYKLSFEIDASSLSFENGQADSGFNKCELVPKTVHEAEVGADKYTTEWLTDEGTGVKYAYSVYVDSYGRNCGAVVIDVNPLGCTFIGTGTAGVTLYGYDANGDLVAFALLSK